MKRFQPYMILAILPLLLLSIGCEEEKIVGPPQGVNEGQVLVEYLESNGDYLNTSAPSIVSAADVRTTQLTAPTTQYLIDIRAAADFTTGRIDGAVNVTLGDLLTHVKGIDAPSYDRIVIVCYSGQTASYGTMALRLMGYSNVYSLKWGMSAWDSTFATGKWLANMSNARVAEFTTAATPRHAAGSLPIILTGKSTGPEILEARVQACLTEGYTSASVNNATLFGALSSYYIVNYWSATDYNAGHVPGAVQYTPKTDLKLASHLKTLPTDKPVVLYCYTGQTSSFVAMYLRILGYDAKSLLYGANAMIYDTMPGSKFGATEIKGYPYVTG